MDNPEKQTILSTQDTRRRQIKFKKTQHTIPQQTHNVGIKRNKNNVHKHVQTYTYHWVCN
jgi:hypothetical protein